MQTQEFLGVIDDIQSEAVRLVLRRHGLQITAPIVIAGRDLRTVYQESLSLNQMRATSSFTSSNTPTTTWLKPEQADPPLPVTSPLATPAPDRPSPPIIEPPATAPAPPQKFLLRVYGAFISLWGR